MADYDEFRVQLSPILGKPGQWSVQILDCNIAGLVGHRSEVASAFKRQQLIRLRTRTGWPNIRELTEAGRDVWDSLLKPLQAEYLACFEVAKEHDRGLRLVVTLSGQEADQPLADGVSISELPIEALCDGDANFLAPRPLTPVSRSFQAKLDQKPTKITLPLRILVVIATPSELPATSMAEEKRAIETALKPFTGPNGAVHLEICAPGTLRAVSKLLDEQPFQVVHFIAHGNFDIVGDDPTPRAFICLDDGNGSVLPLDARRLDMLLKDKEVRLVVMTACASAAPAGDDVPYRLSAFEGMAQKLLSRNGSDVSAVVAMQFDFESRASPIFSETFYEYLLKPNVPLDEAVARARKEVALNMEPGHRAWVTPTLYVRTEGFKVFEFNDIRAELPDEVRRKIIEIDSQIEVYRRAIADMLRLPESDQANLKALRDDYQRKLDQLNVQRGELLGDSLRLVGGQAKPGQSLSCRLRLRLRSPARIDTVEVSLLYPKDGLAFHGARPIAGGAIPTSGFLPDLEKEAARKILILNVSGGAEWPEGEYELADLDFKVRQEAPDTAFMIRLQDAAVTSNPVKDFAALDGVAFVLREESNGAAPIRGERAVLSERAAEASEAVAVATG